MLKLNLLKAEFASLRMLTKFAKATCAEAEFVNNNLAKAIIAEADLSAVNCVNADVANTKFAKATFAKATSAEAKCPGAKLCNLLVRVLLR